MRKSLLTAAVLVLAASTACSDLSSINETRHENRSFTLPGKTLTIDSKGTDVRLVTGDELSVERTLTGKATADGNASWSMSGDRLTLRVECSGFVPDCGGLHVVRVPAGTAVTITNNAAVRAVAPTGTLTATVQGSWLKVENPKGTLHLRAEQSVTVTGAASADVTATSDESSVDLGFGAAPERVTVKAATQGTVTLPAGSYRVSCGCDAPSDPKATRTVSVQARTAQVRKAA